MSVIQKSHPTGTSIIWIWDDYLPVVSCGYAEGTLRLVVGMPLHTSAKFRWSSTPSHCLITSQGDFAVCLNCKVKNHAVWWADKKFEKAGKKKKASVIEKAWAPLNLLELLCVQSHCAVVREGQDECFVKSMNPFTWECECLTVCCSSHSVVDWCVHSKLASQSDVRWGVVGGRGYLSKAERLQAPQWLSVCLYVNRYFCSCTALILSPHHYLPSLSLCLP